MIPVKLNLLQLSRAMKLMLNALLRLSNWQDNSRPVLDGSGMVPLLRGTFVTSGTYAPNKIGIVVETTDLIAILWDDMVMSRLSPFCAKNIFAIDRDTVNFIITSNHIEEMTAETFWGIHGVLSESGDKIAAIKWFRDKIDGQSPDIGLKEAKWIVEAIMDGAVPPSVDPDPEPDEDFILMVVPAIGIALVEVVEVEIEERCIGCPNIPLCYPAG